MRWFVRGLVFGVLVVETAAFLPPQFSDFADSRDPFVQTMYSDAYICSARYELEMEDGNFVELPIVSYSQGRLLGRDAMQRDVVPAFRDWMCSRFTTGAQTTRVSGNVRCRTALDGFDARIEPNLCPTDQIGAI
jgi:hypothetical protein